MSPSDRAVPIKSTVRKDALVGSVPPDYNLLTAFILSNSIWMPLVDLVRRSLSSDCIPTL